MTLHGTNTSKAKESRTRDDDMTSTLMMNGGQLPNDNVHHKQQPQNINLTIGCLSMSKITKASQSHSI